MAGMAGMAGGDGLVVMVRSAISGLTVWSTLKQTRDGRVGQLGHCLYPNNRPSTTCVLIGDNNHSWLESVFAGLNSALTKAAYDAGAYVTFESPQYLFSGHNLCTFDNAINGFDLTLTLGDSAQRSLFVTFDSSHVIFPRSLRRSL